MTPGKWIDDGRRVIISTPVVQSLNSSMRKAQYARVTVCWHQTVSPVGYLRSHTDRTIDKSDHHVHRLSEFYPYAILKPKEINCDRDTWLKDPDEQTLYGNGPANWQPPFL